MKAVKTPGGSHTVQFGTTPISFEVLFSQRKTISLHVYPDQSIEVDAPAGTDHSAIEAFVRRRGGWILKHLRELEDCERPSTILPRRYVSGESYRYLGRQYRLKVVEDAVERVVLSRGWLTVGVSDPGDKIRVRAILHRWYRAHAERIFADRFAACYEKVEPLGVPMPRLLIRAMMRRWGSCSRKGTITLNMKLVQAPRSLIDYVILHELCHLKELNHNPRYWSMLDRVLPGWQRLRDALNHYEFGEI